MTRRMHGTITFSYLVDEEEYFACPSTDVMAFVDQELMETEPEALLAFLERSDVVDISVVPVVSLVTNG